VIPDVDVHTENTKSPANTPKNARKQQPTDY